MTGETKSDNTLWEQYKNNNSSIAKEKLVNNYLPYVNQIVNRVKMSLPASISNDDLLSYGVFGLLDAMDKFDLSRGYKFETYAFPRIRGAILDGVRSIDWIPTSLRQKEKKMISVIGELEQKLGRSATEQEIANELQIDTYELSNLLEELTYTSLVSLDQFIVHDGEDVATLTEKISDDPEKEPENIFDKLEIKNILAEAINKLPENEKLVIALYYYEGLNMKEISKVLKLSESRISQLHTKAIFRMRGRLSRKKKYIF